MKQKLLSLLALPFVACVAQAQWIDLVGLGTDTFTIDPGSVTAVNYSQSASALIFNGAQADAATLGGTFATQDWSNPIYTGFGMVMSLSGANPNLSYSVQFYDAGFGVINTYTGSTVGLTSTPSFSPLTLAIGGTGILSSVAGVQFTWDTGGTINTTVQGVAAVPEPSTYAMLALAAIGVSAYRMRRRG